ncbi:MAG: hypothetical protein RL345_153, partial [Chloroflexota bacterium]
MRDEIWERTRAEIRASSIQWSIRASLTAPAA